mgnify:CR=1 FL=1
MSWMEGKMSVVSDDEHSCSTALSSSVLRRCKLELEQVSEGTAPL